MSEKDILLPNAVFVGIKLLRVSKKPFFAEIDEALHGLSTGAVVQFEKGGKQRRHKTCKLSKLRGL